MRSETIESAAADGLCLRVSFIWLGDRFAHRISVIEPAGEIRPVLESIEGSPTENWPPSPPLQSLSIETLEGGRRAALLVGMAGGSHWSASVEATPGRAELIFDLACRHNKRPEWIGSRYLRWAELAPNWPIITGDHIRVTQEEKFTAVEPSSLLGDRGTTRWKFKVRLAGNHVPGT
jgi:hypothetical protein